MVDLTPFFRPQTVAVVGAGERPTSSGGAVCQNLRAAGYQGAMLPVNPKGGKIFGVNAAADLQSLSEPADLAVIVIRPDLIPDAVRDAAASGHKHLLILPGGFAEAGAAGLARDAEVRALADAAGLTIAGPNCAGLIHLRRDNHFAATFLRTTPPGGGLAFISQSGALAEEVIAAANDRNLPFGSIVSVGNAMHLGVEDYLAYLGDDPDCTALFLYVESIEDPARFRDIARNVAAKKPVVMLMGGNTDPGMHAAAAHTGAVANSEAQVDAFIRDCGAIRVPSLRRLLLAAKGFGRFPQGIGKRVLLLSNSGGPGVLATDQCHLEGLSLPALPEAMAAVLRQQLPHEASVANPLDLLADAREDRFALTFETTLAHAADAFDAILMIHVVPFMVEAAPVIDILAKKAAAAPLPVFHSMMGTLPEKAAWFAKMEAAGVPIFNDVEAMAECAGLLAGYSEARTIAASSPSTPVQLSGRSTR